MDVGGDGAVCLGASDESELHIGVATRSNQKQSEAIRRQTGSDQEVIGKQSGGHQEANRMRQELVTCASKESSPKLSHKPPPLRSTARTCDA